MPLVPVKEVPAAASGEYEIHLDLGSIQGESSSKGHPDAIEIRSLSWEGTNIPVRSAGGTGSTKGGRPSISEMTVVKSVDSASTRLWMVLYTGQLIKTATISLSKSTGGKKPEDYYVIKMTNVFVTSVHLKSGSGEPGLGTETVTLSFDSIEQVYMRQGSDGLLTNAGGVTFNLASGK